MNDKQMEFLWKNLDWKAIEKRVNKLQSRIAKALKEGNGNVAKKLQYLLTKSIFPKLLAVRKVTSNKGKKTPGVDGQLWTTPASKLKAALDLDRKGYKTNPLKRIYIEKKRQEKETATRNPNHARSRHASTIPTSTGPHCRNYGR